jgi:NTE family protein
MVRGGSKGQLRPKIGLVLGAGGVVGQAYQAGVLAALQREAGWDPVTPTSLSAPPQGRSPEPCCGSACPPRTWPRRPTASGLRARGGALLQRILPERCRAAAGSFHRRSYACGACRRRLLITGWRRPTGLPPRSGRHDPDPPRPGGHHRPGPGPGRIHGRHLARGLRICAVRRSDGARVVFGREGSPPAKLAPPCWPRAPFPATSPRSPLTARSTSTAGCTRSPMPTCSRTRSSTRW